MRRRYGPLHGNKCRPPKRYNAMETLENPFCLFWCVSLYWGPTSPRTACLWVAQKHGLGTGTASFSLTRAIAQEGG